MLAGRRFFLLVLTAVGLLVVAYFVFSKKLSKFERFTLAAVLAGGLGNFIDRALHGYVVDFFDCMFINFPVFNVADCFICVGMFLFAAYVFYDELAKKKRSEG